MPAISQFLAFAIGGSATVLTPTQLAGQSWLQTGFTGGLEQPAFSNVLWRQSSFVTAGIAQWMANTLNTNVNDNGNLSSFITQFSQAMTTIGQAGVTSFNSRRGAVTLNSADVITALTFTPLSSFDTRTGDVILNFADVTDALHYTPVNKSGDTMVAALNGPTPTIASHYATKSYVDNRFGGGQYTAANGIQIANKTIEFATVPNNTVLGNISGVTNFPIPLTAANLAQLFLLGAGGVLTGSAPMALAFPLGNGGILQCGFLTWSQFNNGGSPPPPTNNNFPPGQVSGPHSFIFFAEPFSTACVALFAQMVDTQALRSDTGWLSISRGPNSFVGGHLGPAVATNNAGQPAAISNIIFYSDASTTSTGAIIEGIASGTIPGGSGQGTLTGGGVFWAAIGF